MKQRRARKGLPERIYMKELKVALGFSSHAANWKNSTITWEELCRKLGTTTYTSETPEEYAAMSRDARQRIKDHGGFVGGYLIGGKRRKENVKCRSLLVLDGDFVDVGFILRFRKGCRYAAFLYTTHSHTKESPRVRIVIPLDEDVSPDMYIALARYFAADWGIELFDPCSYKVNQMMYWPTTPKGGEFIGEEVKGPFLNAAEYLVGHPGWEDISKLPVASRENAARRNEGKMQENPLEKSGIVGTFCRTYGIEDAIEKFLPDVYAHSAVEGRYDYIPGEGSAGVVIYEGLFAYSHHATDPAGGRRLNAFDLVRLHRFKDMDEKESFLKMCAFAEKDPLVKEALEKERAEQAKKDFEEIQSGWTEPIPFGRYEVDPFPVDALPPDIADYVKAVAESTQTPVDMAGTAALALIATCVQGKYVIQGKDDWTEPLNIYANVIASPSERKSAVLHAMERPLDNYEVQYNTEHAASVEGNKMQHRILLQRRKIVEDKVTKGTAEEGELEKVAQEIADFVELKPLHLYVDDITTEKLVSVMAENRGRAAIISSEGGIFDTLSGRYTKTVNIDVMLKGYSGDTIRVDRVGRESESVMNPMLTVFLMAQQKVISEVLGNAVFRGRGLTARFLYSMPVSIVGRRNIMSRSVPDELYMRYEQRMVNMLKDEVTLSPHVITLSEEAWSILKEFANEIEPKIMREYAEISDWVGKLAGNTLRIAGLLCRAGSYNMEDFLSGEEHLVVGGDVMAKAVRLGRYFLSHALAVYDVVPEETMYKNAKRILRMIREKKLEEFDRRTAMRNCRAFKTVQEIQPVLDFLDSYGYITQQPDRKNIGGRPPLPKYSVNPAVLSDTSNDVTRDW